MSINDKIKEKENELQRLEITYFEVKRKMALTELQIRELKNIRDHGLQ